MKEFLFSENPLFILELPRLFQPESVAKVSKSIDTSDPCTFLAEKVIPFDGCEAGELGDKIRDVRDGQENLTNAAGDFA